MKAQRIFTIIFMTTIIVTLLMTSVIFADSENNWTISQKGESKFFRFNNSPGQYSIFDLDILRPDGSSSDWNGRLMYRIQFVLNDTTTNQNYTCPSIYINANYVFAREEQYNVSDVGLRIHKAFSIGERLRIRVECNMLEGTFRISVLDLDNNIIIYKDKEMISDWYPFKINGNEVSGSQNLKIEQIEVFVDESANGTPLTIKDAKLITNPKYNVSIDRTYEYGGSIKDSYGNDVTNINNVNNASNKYLIFTPNEGYFLDYVLVNNKIINKSELINGNELIIDKIFTDNVIIKPVFKDNFFNKNYIFSNHISSVYSADPPINFLYNNFILHLLKIYNESYIGSSIISKKSTTYFCSSTQPGKTHFNGTLFHGENLIDEVQERLSYGLSYKVRSENSSLDDTFTIRILYKDGTEEEIEYKPNVDNINDWQNFLLEYKKDTNELFINGVKREIQDKSVKYISLNENFIVIKEESFKGTENIFSLSNAFISKDGVNEEIDYDKNYAILKDNFKINGFDVSCEDGNYSFTERSLSSGYNKIQDDNSKFYAFDSFENLKPLISHNESSKRRQEIKKIYADIYGIDITFKENILSEDYENISFIEEESNESIYFDTLIDENYNNILHLKFRTSEPIKTETKYVLSIGNTQKKITVNELIKENFDNLNITNPKTGTLYHSHDKGWNGYSYVDEGKYLFVTNNANLLTNNNNRMSGNMLAMTGESCLSLFKGEEFSIKKTSDITVSMDSAAFKRNHYSNNMREPYYLGHISLRSTNESNSLQSYSMDIYGDSTRLGFHNNSGELTGQKAKWYQKTIGELYSASVDNEPPSNDDFENGNFQIVKKAVPDIYILRNYDNPQGTVISGYQGNLFIGTYIDKKKTLSVDDSFFTIYPERFETMMLVDNILVTTCTVEN